MWPDPNSVATQSSFARLVGVSQPAINQLKAKGVLPEGGTHEDWLLLYCERLRAEAAGRMQDERLSDVRIRETEMSANLKELEYLGKLKQVIFVDDIAPLLNEFCSAVQFHVMSAQERIIETVESKHEITLNDDDINKPLRAAIESVASGAEELIARISSSDDGVEASEESNDN